VIVVSVLAATIVIGAAAFALWRVRHRQPAATPAQDQERGGRGQGGGAIADPTFVNPMYAEVGEAEAAYEEVGLGELAYADPSGQQRAEYDAGLHCGASPERQTRRLSALDDELPPTPRGTNGVQSDYAQVSMQQLYFRGSEPESRSGDFDI